MVLCKIITLFLFWYVFQIEDLSQQAQMAAAKDFQRQEHPAGLGDLPSTVSQPIQEESEEEEEV